ncbi:MAG TPA: quinolinate synthase NadA [Dehalococcoidia bacterium]|nr:quinolinate synthase NadA [Dehalococcoidia bacterium]
MNNFKQLKERIARLKEELGAVIVAHNYQRAEVQDIADFVGDSLELSRQCTEVDAKTIVFCGVRFMAETAAILNPHCTVLLSEGNAGCPLADMININELRAWKQRCSGASVVCYINSSAEIKAESDICCTSANGVQIVDSIPSNDILFIPDLNLGHYISTKTKKNIILYPGFCYVHHRLKPEQVKLARKLHPEAQVLVHPECPPEVIALADAALSTSQTLRFVKASSHQSFIIGTEEGLLHRLHLDNPDKSFYLISNGQICIDMKKTTLETIVQTMELKQNIVTIPEEVRLKVKQAVDRMLAVSYEVKATEVAK